MQEINICWFRRDLRIFDHHALHKALSTSLPVLCVFIFDDEILSKLPMNDARVEFIHQQLSKINNELEKHQSSLYVKKGNPLKIHKELSEQFNIKKVFYNTDYEPYAIKRDEEITTFYTQKNTEVIACKDQVVFEKNDIIKQDGNPYTVFTPFKNKWLSVFEFHEHTQAYPVTLHTKKLAPYRCNFPTLAEIGFHSSSIKVLPFNLEVIHNYDKNRDFPALSATSYLGPHLRFGTVSVRELVKKAYETNAVFLSELIWREFFMQILYHFPHVVNQPFKPKYDAIPWEHNEVHFKAWCEGKTGYPMVDAGMRELNKTGYMHNRVRMITAGFLCKHLLIDWRWGEAYFAEKLLDYELASNNGNWQWAAGTGCDAAPYFRVFNPITQQQKFDKSGKYIKKWVEELNSFNYPKPIVEHAWARKRAINRYKLALQD